MEFAVPRWLTAPPPATPALGMARIIPLAFPSTLLTATGVVALPNQIPGSCLGLKDTTPLRSWEAYLR
jgi:hypothetical protein